MASGLSLNMLKRSSSYFKGYMEKLNIPGLVWVSLFVKRSLKDMKELFMQPVQAGKDLSFP